MTLEAQTRAFLSFYYFAFLDNKVAYELALKSTIQLKKQAKKNSTTTFSDAETIRVMKACFKGLQNKKLKISPDAKDSSVLNFVGEVDLGPWRELQRDGNTDEYICLILSKINKYKDEDVAKGLGISVGTVKYRVQKALKQLGANL